MNKVTSKSDAQPAGKTLSEGGREDATQSAEGIGDTDRTGR